MEKSACLEPHFICFLSCILARHVCWLWNAFAFWLACASLARKMCFSAQHELLGSWIEVNCGLWFGHAVYNLTNNIDVENTKLRMEQYQRENKDLIQRNKAKLVSAFFPLVAKQYIGRSLQRGHWDSMTHSLFFLSYILFLSLRIESRRSWRSCCCWSSRAMSSGDWRHCRKSRGSLMLRGRTNRHCWMNWWAKYTSYVHMSKDRRVTLCQM